jgi:EAL domain-containing protein (putative c-di-GMP-specific phosphodiesterase class I)
MVLFRSKGPQPDRVSPEPEIDHHRALEDDLFEIAMQPICCFETGVHLGFEVLVRLRHQGAAVPPDHFIPLAEELGLIVPIGRTVRRKALVARRKMIEAGPSPGWIALNFAAL